MKKPFVLLDAPLDLEGARLRFLFELKFGVPLAVAARKLERPDGTCQGQCDPPKTEGIAPAPRMTAYYWDGKGVDPNIGPPLCPDCTKDWVAHWQEQWDEFRSGRM